MKGSSQGLKKGTLTWKILNLSHLTWLKMLLKSTSMVMITHFDQLIKGVFNLILNLFILKCLVASLFFSPILGSRGSFPRNGILMSLASCSAPPVVGGKISDVFYLKNIFITRRQFLKNIF